MGDRSTCASVPGGIGLGKACRRVLAPARVCPLTMTRHEFISAQAAARRQTVSFWPVAVNLVALGCFIWGAAHGYGAGEAGDLAGVRTGGMVFGVGLAILLASLVVVPIIHRERGPRCPHCRLKLIRILGPLAIASGHCGRCSMPLFEEEKR